MHQLIGQLCYYSDTLLPSRRTAAALSSPTPPYVLKLLVLFTSKWTRRCVFLDATLERKV